MRLVIQETSEKVGEFIANYIREKIVNFKPTEEKKHYVLGLPTGSSPLPIYKRLVAMHKEGKLSFKNVITFNMDEYVGLSPEHPFSYHYFMHENLFKYIDIERQNIHILSGVAADAEAECEAYEAAIKRAGGIDLFLGGIGVDGHIAFNEPGSSLASRTRLKTLTRDTIIVNSRFFESVSQVPTKALTVGVGTIMDAKEVVLIVTGHNKAMALYKTVEEGISHMWTASALQMHRHSMIVCDEDATDELKVKTVKYFKDVESSNRL
ncbi:glucosamine-6-phosphate isomerase [Heterostelium album PN500]|uniref:Glucosamine-6-phosphate isomerase n=1 Tax=Heterostelium pallidum (strain ATCC 26659 / Pp 5 / PN500) TaxID=670386 RepID=D3B8T4_HETP5|nr:glucosamine-6-phosphate isomerase [Heterostelium album PN500]EFA82452.1 glucosamine-6-phosphate isomerase [Heterostelium album PN500]|eukprot:XP_020434569.1 glucosamine-6-phosphate isomerase [Heterostelium album PN500]